MTKTIDIIAKDLRRILYFSSDPQKQRQKETAVDLDGVDDKINTTTIIRRDDLCWVSDDVRISDDPSKVIAGRGLINGSNQTIERGQLLFVSPPTVSVDINQVLRVYRNSSTSSSGVGSSSRTAPGTSTKVQDDENNEGQTRLEQIAETILLKQMKRHVKKHLMDHHNQQGSTTITNDDIIASSFLFLTNNGGGNNQFQYKMELNDSDNDNDAPGDNSNKFFQNILMGVVVEEQDQDTNKQLLSSFLDNEIDPNTLDDDYLLGIIRHNAFGPDFHSYQRMEHEINTNYSTGGNNHSCYKRILAHYPLAAMINHSCTTNAQRVYSYLNDDTEVMIATASRPIKPGEEIVWSYIPPIVDYQRRKEQLKSFGFECTCQRCRLESNLPHPEDDLTTIKHLNQPQPNDLSVDEWRVAIKTLEGYLKKFDNTTARSVRLGWTYFFLNYFNAALTKGSGNEQDVPMEAMKLHFSFVEVHNACTEHLSILHMCYDLAAAGGGGGGNNEQQLKKRKMFIEALKVAHICRYSNAAIFATTTRGGDEDGSNGVAVANMDRLRALLGHTKIILRNQNGWKMAADEIERHNERLKSSSSQDTTFPVRVKVPII